MREGLEHRRRRPGRKGNCKFSVLSGWSAGAQKCGKPDGKAGTPIPVSFLTSN